MHHFMHQVQSRGLQPRCIVCILVIAIHDIVSILIHSLIEIFDAGEEKVTHVDVMPIPPQPMCLGICVSTDRLAVEFLAALITGVITGESDVVVESV